MKREKQERLTCSICQGTIPPVGSWYGGHNAEPVNEGRCCSDCNSHVVVPARLTQAMRDERERKRSAK